MISKQKIDFEPPVLKLKKITFKTVNDFSLYIEHSAVEKNISYVDALLTFCEAEQLDPADISGKINKSLREKLAKDFQAINLLPKTQQLDLC